MTFKVGDLARIIRADNAPVGETSLLVYVGHTVEITGLNTRWSKRIGYYHGVKAKDGRTFNVAIPWLEKLDPPREDLKVVSWETVPWRPTVTA